MYFVLISIFFHWVAGPKPPDKGEKKIVAIGQTACNKSCFKSKLFIQKPIYYCSSNQCVFPWSRTVPVLLEDYC